jgi:hypothetical protein
MAAEEALQVAESSFVVADRVLVETQLLSPPPALGERAEGLVHPDAERGHGVLQTIPARLEPPRSD